MIPFLSLKEQTAQLKAQVLPALERVIDTQGFANGPAVGEFEQQFANYLGVRHVIAVNTGTTSLHAALVTAGVQAGDEVITVSHTWISTVWAISYVGAKTVFADIDPATCGMNPKLVDIVKKAGVTITTLTDAEKAEFVKATAGVKGKVVAKSASSKQIVELIDKGLAEYRAKAGGGKK